MKKINIAEKSFNPFDLIGQKWMLISAGTEDKWNTMTASWGAVGAGEYFTLTVLKDGNRQALNTLGSKSGRDMDKMHESGLTPVFVEGQPTFEEAELVLICRKRGVTDIAPDDMAQEVQDKWYGDHDYHTMYIGEIVAAYEN